MWSLLVITLPTQPSAVRLRLWRALKALGCATLRDGAYVLPVEREAVFEEVAAEAVQNGGSASVLRLAPRDDAQKAEILAQFDRAAAYGQWRAEASSFSGSLPQMNEAEARRRLRALSDALKAIRQIDYYPGPAAEQAQADLLEMHKALERRFSPDEPQAQRDGEIARLDARKFQGRRWATRARPWVDRLACAWLIRRFIDRDAEFIWLKDTASVPRGALGFDFDGARFTHVGARVSFEVLLASFGLDVDPDLQRVGRLVRFLDAGGIPEPDAAGVESVLLGLRKLHDEDDRLVGAAAQVFDALYAAPGERK